MSRAPDPSATSADDEFAQAFLDLGPGLRRTAFVIVRDWQTAEDMVQQAMAKVYAAWGRVRPETCAAYARKAVVNECLSHLRRRRPETLHGDVTQLERGRSLHTVGSTAPAETIQLGPPRRGIPDPPGHQEPDLQAALGLLAPRQRAIVALRFLDDLSVGDVADALGISSGTVKSQSSRALATLRTHLSTHYEPEENQT